MLGNQNRGGRVEGADESTELSRHARLPIQNVLSTHFIGPNDYTFCVPFSDTFYVEQCPTLTKYLLLTILITFYLMCQIYLFSPKLIKLGVCNDSINVAGFLSDVTAWSRPITAAEAKEFASGCNDSFPGSSNPDVINW